MDWGNIMRLKDYLLEDDENKCIHCHKNKPMEGRHVCSKCDKELEKIRNRNKKDA